MAFNIGQAMLAAKLGTNLFAGAEEREMLKMRYGLEKSKLVSGYESQKQNLYYGLGSILEDYKSKQNYNAWASGYANVSDDARFISENNLNRDLSTSVKNIMDNVRALNEAKQVDLQVNDMNLSNALTNNLFGMGVDILDFAYNYWKEK